MMMLLGILFEGRAEVGENERWVDDSYRKAQLVLVFFSLSYSRFTGVLSSWGSFFPFLLLYCITTFF